MSSEKYEQLKSSVEQNLLCYLPETDPESGLLYEAMKYSVEAGGKRIRPVLMMASCFAAGGRPEDVLPYACAIEYIHTYSLIHDDHPSMDDDELRRGKPTNHIVFGDDMAILAGDGLLNSAEDLMLKEIEDCALSGSGDTEKLLRKIRAAREISEAAGIRGMIAGQTSDIHPELIEAEDEKKLLYIHRNKTGALLRAAVRAGAVLGGANEAMLAAFTEYGEQVGIAFQIVDDLLDVIGDVEQLGKNTGMDEERGKLTYPSVFGIEVSQQKAEEATEAACRALSSIGTAASSGSMAEKSAEYLEFLRYIALDLLKRIA